MRNGEKFKKKKNRYQNNDDNIDDNLLLLWCKFILYMVKCLLSPMYLSMTSEKVQFIKRKIQRY